MSEFAAVYRVECRKLLAQARVRAVLVFLLVVPWIYIGLILHQDRLPLETLYGRYLKDTGYATPLAMLVYASQWVLPLVAALIAGDVFSSEDQLGTLKTILTRSVGRTAVFWGKLLAAFTFIALGVIVPVVLGMCMQLYTFLNAWDTVRHVLLGYTMSAWRGVLDSPSYLAPLVRGVAVAAVYLVIATTIGF